MPSSSSIAVISFLALAVPFCLIWSFNNDKIERSRSNAVLLLSEESPRRGRFVSKLDKIFTEAYNRGKADQASKIGIEIPTRSWLRKEAATGAQFSKSPPGHGLTKQDMIRAGLTKQEILTATEERDDMGGMLRLKAVNSRFAKKIEGMLEAIQRKLSKAAATGQAPWMPSTKGLLDDVQPMKDKEWDNMLAHLDSELQARHLDESESDSFRSEERYENAFRRALDPVWKRGSR